MNNKSGSIFNLLQIQDAHFQFLYLHCTLLHLNLAYAQQWRRVTSTVWPWNSPADETCTADAHCLETLPLMKYALLTPTALKLSHWRNTHCWRPLPWNSPTDETCTADAHCLENLPLMKHALLTPIALKLSHWWNMRCWRPLPWNSPTDETCSADTHCLALRQSHRWNMQCWRLDCRIVMRRPSLWLAGRVRKAVFLDCANPSTTLRKKMRCLASPLLERKLMEPVRHLCDGARDCGCVVVSKITQYLHPTHPQNHTATSHTPAKSHIYIPHTRKITVLQNHKIISTTYTPTKSRIYNQHTHKITHLQPTYPQNHTYTNHKIIPTTYTPTKSHNIYNPPTHKTTHLQSTHLQNHTTSTTHKIISTNYTPTKSYSVYNPHTDKITKLINNLHTSRISQRLQPTHPQNHTTSSQPNTFVLQ